MITKIVKLIHNTSQNIACDRYFTGVDLFEQPFKVKLTSIGTVISNSKNLPIALTTKRNREINSTLFAFKDSVTMCSLVPKNGKLVFRMSTLHQTNEIAQSRKPEIIEFYNETKGSIGALDQKIRHY